LEYTNGKFEENRLLNWATIEDAGSEYKLLIFSTDSAHNYSSKFQFALHDSLKSKKILKQSTIDNKTVANIGS